MANKEKGEVALIAGDEIYIIRFSSNALCELEDASGVSAIELANSLADESKFSMKSLRVMLWAGLSGSKEDISLKDTGDIIDQAGLGDVGMAIGKAFELAFPAPKDEDGQEPDAGKNKAAA